MKKYSAYSNIMYLLKGAWEYDRKLLYPLVMQIVFNVITPLIGMMLPARVIAEIEMGSSIEELAVSVLIIFLIYGLMQYGCTYYQCNNEMLLTAARNKKWWNHFVEMSMLMDYEKSEKQEVKEAHSKALQSCNCNVWGIESFFYKGVALLIASISLLLYLTILTNVNMYIVLLLFAFAMVFSITHRCVNFIKASCYSI